MRAMMAMIQQDTEAQPAVVLTSSAAQAILVDTAGKQQNEGVGKADSKVAA